MAINAPIQGTEGDIVRIAMIKIAELIKVKKWTKRSSHVVTNPR